jgi:pimeloyl-ACP methyl ester carboxylesterase
MSAGRAEARRTTEAVPVAGGDLEVGVWQPVEPVDEAPTLLCVHGISSSHRAFGWLADALPRWRILAPDLRGRGRSADLGPPYGMAAHADDLVSMLDHFGLEEVPVLGHSMGAFVAVVLGHRAPGRVSRIVMVDGGLPIPTPPGLDPDELLQTVIGPAADRLAMRFGSVQEHRDFWARHPSFAATWGPDLASYVDYDLVGEPPELRSAAVYEAVRDDSTDLHTGTAYAEALRELSHPSVFLRAERGMLDQPGGLFPREALAALDLPADSPRVREVEDVNHYTIVMSEHGARAVAEQVDASSVTSD